MAPKTRACRARRNEERNLPIPLVLFTSYIAAEKSDELIKVFCKELPGILQNINNCKKALENKTKSVYKLKEAITFDLQKLQLADIVLKELLQDEELSKLNRDKELQMLHSKISTGQDSKRILKCSLTQYSQSQQVLDSIAVESNQYKDALDLIHSYLTLQAMNEKFIEEEYKSANHFKTTEIEKMELQNLLMNHKYNVIVRERKLEILLNHHQIIKNINYSLNHAMNNIVQHRMQELRNRLQIKRWAYDTCQKLSSYKDSQSSTEDFYKLLNEVQEFIVFARKVILKLELAAS